ncbi:unnamed protein product [Rotaria magnacalcarata]|uniref:Endonuclease/exonuclease/phosphatase domain-containing protein n=1 Tax=Rotaria magnacalcarata TaxID=392030 RepID=A0A816N1Q5_9BILA|nr:unnamed protein product [Rotaria magnacalcarata]CAF2055100.1 unnamed protein product [Rotaria magnacalcarata]CAF3751533.1 unnamed protein product [Rotaria magnacalcarata]CAF3941412.1 unnamed protein product [Rotaria magnacalcarata]
MSVHVVSYNLLVPILAEQPEYFYKCHPKYIDRNYRLRLIKSELQQEITQHNNTIICLQELCRTTVPLLKKFFHPHNYYLIHECYGEEFNDYMGVGIAIPNWMKPTSVKVITVGDEIRARLSERRADSCAIWSIFRQRSRDKSLHAASDPWDNAMKKKNILIFIRVMIHGIPLCIGTYHMPCLYRNPDVMMIHASMVKDLVLDLAKGQNMILAGDYNMKPTDSYYRAITERGYAYGHLPKSRMYEVHYQSDRNRALRSAYAEKNGTEPRFTTFSSTPNNPDFCATLDYIFFNGRLAVDTVLPLPNHLTSKSYPDATHPSDHLMIAATFQFV